MLTPDGVGILAGRHRKTGASFGIAVPTVMSSPKTPAMGGSSVMAVPFTVAAGTGLVTSSA